MLFPLILLAAIVAAGFFDQLLQKSSLEETVFLQEEARAQKNVKSKQKQKKKKAKKKNVLTFVDAHGQRYQVDILETVPKTVFCKDCFTVTDKRLHYKDESYQSRLGVDVSHHQGAIDWQRVKAAGYDFAFIRLGYRGYGKSGTVNLDREFEKNLNGAQAAGIDVGVYFFAQAINEAEAAEEAAFVLEHLRGRTLQMPVVYDPESILDDASRTDSVSGEQFTKNTQVFCSQIEMGGYDPMVYSNMVWEAFMFDMKKISQYPIWYADYEKKPQTPYAFSIWQYTEKGQVDGISGTVDLNIEMIAKKKQNRKAQ